VLRSIPRKASGGYDWSSLPDGRYYIEWYESGKRRRETAGLTVAQAQEAQRRKRHELEGRKLGVPGYGPPSEMSGAVPLASAVTQYLEHVETLKNPTRTGSIRRSYGASPSISRERHWTRFRSARSTTTSSI